MIQSAGEFHHLRTSENPDDYARAAQEEAPVAVWREIIAMPDMREWVAYNKSVPLEILETLARDERASVRAMVAMKRKLPEALLFELAQDADAQVRQRVVYNAKATKRVLELLARDPEELIRERAVQRLHAGEKDAGR